jgi:hypothetical protein
MILCGSLKVAHSRAREEIQFGVGKNQKLAAAKKVSEYEFREFHSMLMMLHLLSYLSLVFVSVTQCCVVRVPPGIATFFRHVFIIIISAMHNENFFSPILLSLSILLLSLLLLATPPPPGHRRDKQFILQILKTANRQSERRERNY